VSIEEVKTRIVMLEVELDRLSGMTSDALGSLLLERLALVDLAQGTTNPLLLQLLDQLDAAHRDVLEGAGRLIEAHATAGDVLRTM